MEHIIQFGVTIDDEEIKKRIITNTEKQVMGNLIHEIVKSILETKNPSERDWKKLKDTSIDQIVDVLINNYSEEIVSKAAEILADRLSRTRAARDKLKIVLEDI